LYFFKYDTQKLSWKSFLHYIPFAITLVIVATNHLHHWFWQTSTQVQFGQIKILTNTYGFWFWIHSAFSYLYMLSGAVIILRKIIRGKRFNAQTVLIACGVIFPFFGNLSYILKFAGGVDTTPISLTLSGILLTIGIVRFSLFEISPLARAALFTIFRDPVIFISLDHFLVDSNPSANQFFNIRNYQYWNQKIDELISKTFGVSINLDAQEPFEINLNSATEHSTFELEINLVKNKSKQGIGYLLVFHDISTLKRNEELISEQANFFSILNTISGIALSSTNIEELLFREMDNLQYILKADLGIMINASKSQDPFGIESGHSEDEKKLIRDEYIQKQLDKSSKKRILSLLNAEDFPPSFILENPNIKRLLLMPIFSDQTCFGTFLFTFTTDQPLTKFEYNLLDHTIKQTMLSLSRLKPVAEIDQTTLPD
jgi:hypothetical protein